MSDSLVDRLLDENVPVMVTSFDEESTDPRTKLSKYFSITSNGEIVPSEDSLNKLGTQDDNNMTVVQFRCPKYYVDNLLSGFNIYVIYERSDGVVGKTKCNLISELTDDSTIYFNWLIGKHTTEKGGPVRFRVCFKLNDTIGREVHTEIYESTYVSSGIKDPVEEGEDNDNNNPGDDGNDEFESITIKSFELDVTSIDYGAENVNVNVNFELSTLPSDIILTYPGETENVTETLTVNGLLYTVPISIAKMPNSDISVALEVKDPYTGEIVTETKSIKVGYSIYYGSAELTDNPDATFVTTKLKKESNKTGKLSLITDSVPENEYLYYCHPKTFGTCSFTWNNVWPTVFDCYETTITNNGVSVDYYVYKSPEHGLGDGATFTIE